MIQVNCKVDICFFENVKLSEHFSKLSKYILLRKMWNKQKIKMESTWLQTTWWVVTKLLSADSVSFFYVL